MVKAQDDNKKLSRLVDKLNKVLTIKEEELTKTKEATAQLHSAFQSFQEISSFGSKNSK